ncbi:MAG: hypothetical protein L3V56_04240 [Candidatus Magnetoovum sp. WYHC-5]|nr:hypothetical protein [Candidatus Magnetoovum sp. WYHC-5]
MGVFSILLYIGLFAMQGVFNGYFGKGGGYAIFPILIAFLFSFVHGNFTGEFWSIIGIEAKKERR